MSASSPLSQAKQKRDKRERYDRRYANALRKLCADSDFRLVASDWLFRAGGLMEPGRNDDFGRGRQDLAADLFQSVRNIVPDGAALIMHEEITDEHGRNDRE